jgi:Phosphodiester glycosidase
MALAALLALALAAGAAALGFFFRPRPAGVARPLFQGVFYTREVATSPRPVLLHLVTIDLGAPGIGFFVTPGEPGKALPLAGRTTSEFAAAFHVQVAVNGDFFAPFYSKAPWDYYPRSGDPVSVDGLAASGGVVYSREARNPRPRTLYITCDEQVGFDAPPGETCHAISGISLLERGEPRVGTSPFSTEPNPRTAVALDRARARLLLVAVDGRQPRYSEGLTLPELAELLLRRGGHDAMVLDGGGSTTLVAEGPSGAPEVLNCPFHTKIPCRERPVANHLGVFAAPLAGAPAAHF